MKREFARFIDGPSDRVSDASVEVYVIVADEARRGRRRKHLALALLAAASGAALLAAGLALGGGGRPRPARMTAARPSIRVTLPSSCVRGVGYGGLGAPLSAFDADNDNSTGPAGPSPGPACYTVNATVGGCVIAFAVQEYAGPPPTASDMLLLVSHPYLPHDARQLVGTRSCAIWKSVVLERATGHVYALATASPQVGRTPGRAQIEATSKPRC